MIPDMMPCLICCLFVCWVFSYQWYVSDKIHINNTIHHGITD